MERLVFLDASAGASGPPPAVGPEPWLEDTGPFGFNAIKERVRTLQAKGTVDIWLRIDYAHDSRPPGRNLTLPRTGDTGGLQRLLDFAVRVAADDVLGNVRGIICGNEPNSEHERSIPMADGSPSPPFYPWWVARCVYGHGRPDTETSNLYQYIKTYARNPNMSVLAPAVAPWNAQTDGDMGSQAGDPYLPFPELCTKSDRTQFANPDRNYPCPPDDRPNLNAWERYQFALAWRSYRNNWHAPYEQVRFAMHCYSNVLQAADPKETEPDQHLRNVNWHNAYSGVRALDDFLYQIYTASDMGSGPAAAPIVISEWNSLIGTASGPSWPSENYPAGLMRNAVRKYIACQQNVMGFAAFVDQNYGGGCPEWIKSAVTGYLDSSGCITGDPNQPGTEKYRLRTWDDDMNDLLLNGWPATC